MKPGRYRWFVFAVFFVFMLLHQCDQLLIGPLTTPIMESFGIDEAQMGVVFSGALLVGAVLYPLWGYLYDRYARSRLLALAALIWGATTWLSAVVRTFPGFVITRASTGIDNSSYPGLYSVIADYYEPRVRGRVNGLLQISQPLGYLVGMVLALMLGAALGWRAIFYLTGGLGVILAAIIFFGVREPRRGASEPELRGVEPASEYRFNWPAARALLRNRTVMLLCANGFFGVFPWQVITFWFFRYLEKERGYSATEVLITMVAAVLVLAAGYPLGGLIGDQLFRRFPRGRLWVAGTGVICGAVLLTITFRIPATAQLPFGLMMCLTALFMPLASANVISSVYDVTVPEVRSTANALLNLIEQIGSASAPALAGMIAVRHSLGAAILSISIGAWAVCAVFLFVAARFTPTDQMALRKEMLARAEMERARAKHAAA
ncbi:MAG: MFS transporter [Anaerolineae bacterium]